MDLDRREHPAKKIVKRQEVMIDAKTRHHHKAPEVLRHRIGDPEPQVRIAHVDSESHAHTPHYSPARPACQPLL